MAARENQGLQIALIVFVVLTVLLSLTTFVFFRNYQGEQLKATRGEGEPLVLPIVGPMHFKTNEIRLRAISRRLFSDRKEGNHRLSLGKRSQCQQIGLGREPARRAEKLP